MAEENEEKPKAFKVDDRRRFSSEGDVLPQAESKTPGPGEHKRPPSDPAQSGGQSAAGGAASTASPAAEVNFAAFVVSLSTQALMLLGEIKDPAAQIPRDLDGAQQIIDILGMLRDKTRGNLDRNEEGLLDSILYDLRLKYVEIARQPAR